MLAQKKYAGRRPQELDFPILHPACFDFPDTPEEGIGTGVLGGACKGAAGGSVGPGVAAPLLFSPLPRFPGFGFCQQHQFRKSFHVCSYSKE